MQIAAINNESRHLMHLGEQAVLEQGLQRWRGRAGHRLHRDGLALHCSLPVAQHSACRRLQIRSGVHRLQQESQSPKHTQC